MIAPKTKSAGFTLIELLIAVLITGLAFMGIFALVHLGVDSQVYVREMSDAEQVGPTILGQIAEDLRNAYFYNITENNIFEGHMVEEGREVRLDQFHFITTRPSLLADADLTIDDSFPQFSPLTEVSYICKKGSDGFSELHRREQNFVDKDQFSGGYIRMITDRLRAFKVQYYGFDFASDQTAEQGAAASGAANGAANGANANGANANTNRGNVTAGDANKAKNRDRNKDGNLDDPEGKNDTGIIWEDEWSAATRGCLPVAVKIELIVSPDIDPKVMKLLARQKKIERLDKSYVQYILLPQYRESEDLMRETYAWDGVVREPAPPGRARGNRGANGRGEGQGDPRGGARGGQPGQGGKPAQGFPVGGNPGQGQGGGSNPFLDAIRGGGGQKK